jgi:aspartyl-tRNA synthetase
MARQIEKKMKQFSYVWLDDVKRTIDGQLARGVDYDYVVNGINMTGESLVIKSEDNLYYFHMYARKVRREESLEVFTEILDNVAIVE